MKPHLGSVHLVVSAAPPVLEIATLVEALSALGWQVSVIATPTAASWVDLVALAERTGCLVRAEARPPGEGKSLPRADLVLAAPLTFNSLNKWSAGISDSVALGVLNELLCAEAPIIAAPCAKASLREHPAYADSVERLSRNGVVVLDPEAITLRTDSGLATFDWARIVSAVVAVTGGASGGGPLGT
ncbi:MULTISPECIES: flavoprotein [Actinosynnema]|uniref:flavoprotein n=1 Tax=Actinosynnema TaxID=40566 RepID=UPI0020A27AEF|nr:flavoprotein [Actinosynnema pretiosum]MCP2098114.1 Flavoprotein [Actinosynnema pretiosum]